MITLYNLMTETPNKELRIRNLEKKNNINKHEVKLAFKEDRTNGTHWMLQISSEVVKRLKATKGYV